MQAQLSSVPQSSAYAPAELGKRFLAALIDGIIGAVLGSLGALPGIIYLLIKDGLFDGRSVGKKVMGLRVVNVVTGQPCDFKASAIRHVVSIVPCVNAIYGIVEIVMVLTKPDRRRFGDKWADTMVIEG
jgi:uncharacterized RDD family membrane protein YckC